MQAASAVVGAQSVRTDLTPSMAAEDFAFMIRDTPGAYVWLGNGTAEGGRNLHSPNYRFNDAILPIGAQYFGELARCALSDLSR